MNRHNDSIIKFLNGMSSSVFSRSSSEFLHRFHDISTVFSFKPGKQARERAKMTVILTTCIRLLFTNTYAIHSRMCGWHFRARIVPIHSRWVSADYCECRRWFLMMFSSARQSIKLDTVAINRFPLLGIAMAFERKRIQKLGRMANKSRQTHESPPYFQSIIRIIRYEQECLTLNAAEATNSNYVIRKK